MLRQYFVKKTGKTDTFFIFTLKIDTIDFEKKKTSIQNLCLASTTQG